MITSQQYSVDRDDKSINLSLEEIEASAEEIINERKMTNRICYKNLLNYYN